ncbi:Chromodomain-helicase-DNA-binding protein 3 [Fasciola hepatica]|uniref:Chromodomain-helicase-DNA-binding protein 3 n=1 Tax=Fasciola hepatica TaxID=6192 RepID=A0A4E0RB07_FASHE|nr:Chromodomain-helicase-DNA-binding protein 3 [Fasciola hepatica]
MDSPRHSQCQADGDAVIQVDCSASVSQNESELNTPHGDQKHENCIDTPIAGINTTTIDSFELSDGNLTNKVSHNGEMDLGVSFANTVCDAIQQNMGDFQSSVTRTESVTLSEQTANQIMSDETAQNSQNPLSEKKTPSILHTKASSSEELLAEQCPTDHQLERLLPDACVNKCSESNPGADHDATESKQNDVNTSCLRSSHIRKSLRPRKLLSFGDALSDFVTGEEALVFNKVREPPVSEVASDFIDLPPSPTVRTTSLEGERRRSLRPRRTVKQTDTFENEAELDRLLSDKVTLQAYGPAQHWNTGEYITKNWVAVEKILSHRPLKPKKVTKLLNDAINSYPDYQRELVTCEYFVKFHEQSYWHCAWVPGAMLLALHPSMVRYYMKNLKMKLELQPTLDVSSSSQLDTNRVLEDGTQSKKNISNALSPRQDRNLSHDETISETGSVNIPGPDNSEGEPGSGAIPLIIQHSSEELSDEEDKLDNKNDYGDVVNWTSKSPSGAGARRHYLLRWGVESFALVPERIIAVTEPFTPLGSDGNILQPDGWPERESLLYRHVFVKWLHLSANHYTWEIIEADLDVLEQTVRCPEMAQLKSIKPPDEPEGKLLPVQIRRHLIQLTNLYCRRIAVMLCEAYGARKVLSKQLPPCADPMKAWNACWMNGQPGYLSPVCKCVLHPYQVEGVRWLWHAYHGRINAILADEMGLGKTVQVITLLYLLWKERKDYGPFIIIAPLSTLLNWQREFQIWAPDFHVIVYSGEKSSRTIMQEYELFMPNTHGLATFHVLITSHELACIERPCLQAFNWSVLVVDEAHRLKNKQSRLFKETSQYKADFKVLLTGTPLQNTLEELFHLLNFVDPKTFASFKSLSEQWLDMPKEERIAHLHKQLKHHLLRRLKADVIRDLPKKSEILVFVDLTTLQRKLYKLILTKNYEELRSGSLMNSLMHLQKVCDHPYLLPAGDSIAPRVNPSQPNSAYEPRALIQVSGKMSVLSDMLEGLKSRGHRVLLYSRLTTMLDILEEAILNAGYSYERFDGSVKGPIRQLAIDRFNAPNSKAFIFLLSTRAGGEGINLASADTVILFDSDWNPQCDLQALSRAHRIGQSRHVVVYRFVTRNTMEERIYSVARRKLALTHLVVDQHEQRKQNREEWRNRQAETNKHNAAADAESPFNTPHDSESTSREDAEDGSVTDSSATTVQTSAASAPIVSSGNRLSRPEMNEMLRHGVESLFSLDDQLDESELFKAARDCGSDDTKRIVYDAAAIDRLLDRSNLSADKEEPKSVADEYLSVFRVAHFDQATDPSLPNSNASPAEPATAAAATDVSSSTQKTNEPIGYATFWDRLLRERYMRLTTADNKLRENSKRVVRSVRRYSYDRDMDFESPSELMHTDSFRPPQFSNTDFRTSTSLRPAGSRSARSAKCKRALKRHLSTKVPTMSTGHDLDGDQKTAATRRPMLPRDISPNSSISSGDVHTNPDQVDSDDDPPYVPSDESADEVVSETGVSFKCKSARTEDDARNEQLEPVLRNRLGEIEIHNIIPMSGEVEPLWIPSLKTSETWKRRIPHLDPKITFENGHMFIYDFGPNDRQAFAGAVMRFGLPPPGIVPPQEWLPNALHHKSPANLFAYTSVFMRHLYDDPNGMDELTNCWSDGLPKESLCVPAVLSRIAIMALIRNKILEFEDINGVHSRTFEAVSTRFKFTIHEGGLTLLRPTWHEEWQCINRIMKPVMKTIGSWTSATKKREEAMYHLQHTWHSRHDFWLLAGIHIHGYMRWNDILMDPRFHLLCTGLEDQTAERQTSVQQNLTKPHGFLLTRLRMLEQALVVEQALREVARAALSGSGDVAGPPVLRVQNLTVCLSNKLAAAGPRKRIALPKEPQAREATRAAVMALQDILEDFYADLPGLPAFVVYTETDDTATNNNSLDPMDDGQLVGTDPADVVDPTPSETEQNATTEANQSKATSSDSLVIEISDDDTEECDSVGRNNDDNIYNS